MNPLELPRIPLPPKLWQGALILDVIAQAGSFSSGLFRNLLEVIVLLIISTGIVLSIYFMERRLR